MIINYNNPDTVHIHLYPTSKVLKTLSLLGRDS